MLNFQNYISQIFKFLEENQSDLSPKDIVEKAAIHQYIEYVLIYASYIDNSQSTNTILGVCNQL